MMPSWNVPALAFTPAGGGYTTLPVATRAERVRNHALQSLKWVTGLVIVGWGAVRLYEQRRLRRVPGMRSLRKGTIPEDYRAAGVIFYTLEKQEPCKVLLAVEERRVSLKELGLGSGSGQRRVLLFPQGKREPEDEADFISTARREFIEETGDPTNLARHLEGDLDRTWYMAAKMAVVFCEVPSDEATMEGFKSQAAPKPTPKPKARRQQPRQQEKEAHQHKPLPLQPVWVNASDLSSAVKPTSTGEVNTDIGRFHLFPVSRKFFQIAEVSRWLGVVAPRR
eukprot:symbB.v1.2.004404.t1/scaffold247.1/size253962/4